MISTLKTSGLISCVLFGLVVSGCSQDHTSGSTEKVEIKAAPKLTNDATTYANEAWKLINQIDPIVYDGKKDEIEEQVRKPLRKLSTDWRINV